MGGCGDAASKGVGLMAGDWIKMRGNLWDDPRVSRLCDLTGQAEAMVIGGLYWLWAAADQHTEDGRLEGLSLGQINRKTGIAGFGEALCQVGWIQDDPGGVLIPRFEEHNGASAKRRSSHAQRMSKGRGKQDGQPSQRAHAAQGVQVVPPAAPESSTSSTTTPHAESAQGAQSVLNQCAECAQGVRDACASCAQPCAHFAQLELEKSKNTNTPQPPGRGAAIGLRAWLDRIRAGGEKAIPEGDPVFGYADKVGIPADFLALAWQAFKVRYTALYPDKRYRDWRRVFRRAVAENWLRLWYADPVAGYALTTVGVQAQRQHREAA